MFGVYIPVLTVVREERRNELVTLDRFLKLYCLLYVSFIISSSTISIRRSRDTTIQWVCRYQYRLPCSFFSVKEEKNLNGRKRVETTVTEECSKGSLLFRVTRPLRSFARFWTNRKKDRCLGCWRRCKPTVPRVTQIVKDGGWSTCWNLVIRRKTRSQKSR